KASVVLLRRRPAFIAAFQACLVACALLFAWLLRFDFTLPYRAIFLSALPILVAVRVTAMACFGLHRGWWRYTGINDGMDILKAVAAGSVVFFLLCRNVLGMTSFPRTIYVLEALMTAGLLVSVRMCSRLFAESVREDTGSCKRVIIIGAGAAAHTILREIRRPGNPYIAIGCVDDDQSKQGIRIDNVRVLGTVSQLAEVLAAQPADEALIAVPSATGAEMRRFAE